MKQFLLLAFPFFCSVQIFGQYSFSGSISDKTEGRAIYLSIIEDYRKMSRTYLEQVIKKTVTDSTGHFEFTGDNLLNENRIYKIHIDECANENNASHFLGNCTNTKSILFIAKAKDTLYFPTTFNDEVFCELESTNTSSADILKINELLGNMAYDYASFHSDANKRLTSKKWFQKLKDYGEELNEPLSELYIYAFLSDRQNETFDYFIKDIDDNAYYTRLSNQLEEKYPDASFIHQYQNEIESFLALKSNFRSSNKPWIITLAILLSISLFANFRFWTIIKHTKKYINKNSMSELSQQEQKVVELMKEGMTNKEIADTLYISLSTVKSHINMIYRKLNIGSRNDLKQL